MPTYHILIAYAVEQAYRYNDAYRARKYVDVMDSFESVQAEQMSRVNGADTIHVTLILSVLELKGIIYQLQDNERHDNHILVMVAAPDDWAINSSDHRGEEYDVAVDQLAPKMNITFRRPYNDVAQVLNKEIDEWIRSR